MEDLKDKAETELAEARKAESGSMLLSNLVPNVPKRECSQRSHGSERITFPNVCRITLPIAFAHGMGQADTMSPVLGSWACGGAEVP